VSNELTTSNGSHNFEKLLNEDVTHVLHVTCKMFYSWPTHVKDFFNHVRPTFLVSYQKIMDATLITNNRKYMYQIANIYFKTIKNINCMNLVFYMGSYMRGDIVRSHFYH
jgi:hypothetical protein